MKKFLRQKNKGFTRTPKFGVTPKGGGFTLVETLVAISIFTLSILSLMSVLASGISNTTYAKNKIIAGYLAQEGIECARNTRDNYVLFSDVTHDWNKFVLLNVNNITCPSVATNFTRTITKDVVNKVTNNELKITSDVFWKQGSGTYHATFSENLFNWIQ